MKLRIVKHIALGTAVTLLSSSTLVNMAHSSELLRVFMNHARILKFEQPVSSVIVGNSEVADITVSDPTTVVLTGKSYGSTNLVILNDEGEAVVDKRIVVSVDEENSVRIFRQIDRTVLSCAPICEEQSN
ncbi:MAG: pilus assembly protein N-terminal domain-containing protein [Lentilitoribacter sp.]